MVDRLLSEGPRADPHNVLGQVDGRTVSQTSGRACRLFGAKSERFSFGRKTRTLHSVVLNLVLGRMEKRVGVPRR